MLPLEKLTKLRHELHAHPELSGQEEQTAKRVIAYLQKLKPDAFLTGLGGHGIVATFDSGKPGPALLLRSELDALPIEEINTFAHRSSVQGISHKCGHDGHTTILCGVAEGLAQQRPAKGKVHLLFQPAEETGSGAEAILNDPRFSSITPDIAVALHNFPGYKHHSVIIKNGIFTAAVSSLILRLQGKTAHASQPEYGLNPALAVAELLKESDAFNLNDPASENFQLVTPVYTRVGSPAYGVAAGDGEVHFTLRAWENTHLETLRSNIIHLAKEIGLAHQLELTHESLQNFHANINDSASVEIVKASALDLGLEVIELSDPLKGGEDFGVFTARFPCCMFALGAGETTPALHNPDYDFPDELIETGVKLFDDIVRKVLR
jgi:amidohydrolase